MVGLMLKCGERGLAEADTSIVRRNALRPVRLKTFFAQARDRSFHQITILKAATRKRDARMCRLLCHCHDGFDKCVVEAR